MTEFNNSNYSKPKPNVSTHVIPHQHKFAEKYHEQESNKSDDLMHKAHMLYMIGSPILILYLLFLR